MYSFAGIWIEIIGLLVLGIIGSIIILFFCKETRKIIRYILVICMIIIFGFNIFKSVKALINPQIETVTAIYCGFQNKRGTTNTQYCFRKGDQKLYLDMDIFMCRKINANNKMVVGETYTIAYEKNEKVILLIE